MSAIPLMSRVVASSLALLFLAACQEQAKGRAPSATPSASVALARSATPPVAEPAEDPPPDEVMCRRFADTPVPEAHLVSDAERAALRGCDAEAAYYGLNGAVDDVRALRCAFSQTPPDADMLAMIYANGRGVPQNFALALRFACQAGGARAELGGRLATLWKAKQVGRLELPFEICDFVTSSVMLGYCAAHEERVSSVQRKARLKVLETKLPKTELHALQKATQRYIDARSRFEVDQSGSMRAAFSLSEETALAEQLVTTLEQLSTPPHPAEDPARAVRDVRALVSRIRACKSMAQSERLIPGTSTRAGILQTQAAWQGYQSSFATLVHKVLPEADANAWLGWLAAERRKQLTELASDC